MLGPRFTSQRPFDASHPDAIAVYCSDGRFTDAVEELLRHLGHARLDTVTMPGGPGLLDLSSAGLSALEATRRGVSLLVTAHKARRAVLLSHEGCGYYRQRYPMETPTEIVTQQILDLRLAARWLRGAHDGLDLLLYFARIACGNIVFEPVEELVESSIFAANAVASPTTPQNARSPASAPPPLPPGAQGAPKPGKPGRARKR